MPAQAGPNPPGNGALGGDVHCGNLLKPVLCSSLGSRANACASQDLSFLICAMGGLEGEEAAGPFQSALL